MTKPKLMKKNQVMKVYGQHACLKIFEKRPLDIVRAYVTQEGVFEFRPLIKYLADHKKAYHVVEKDELDSITKATHHENICLIVKLKKQPDLKELMSEPGRKLILCLAEVENPHNLGAILRSAAHFGVSALLYESKVPVAQSAAALRTAEGGAECVPAFQVTDWSFVFDQAKRCGFKSFATSGHAGEPVFEVSFPDKSLVFFGAEREGLSEKLIKKMDHRLKIPGTGEVESLNVSNATAVILSEWYRQANL